MSVTQNLEFVLGKVENILGKGENAGDQHFLLFPKFFQKPLFSESLKVKIVWLPAFSPFPKMFSKASFLRVVKSQDCEFT